MKDIIPVKIFRGLLLVYNNFFRNCVDRNKLQRMHIGVKKKVIVIMLWDNILRMAESSFKVNC